MRGETEAGNLEVEKLEDEIAEVCGILNVATGRLVSLIARVLATEAYSGMGIRSPEQWVVWKCGVSARRARSLVAMARRLPELPECGAALAGGELSEDQVGVIVRHTPVHNDAEVATLARSTTVPQLRRAVARLAFAEPEPDEGRVDAQPEEPRRVSFGFDDDGCWRLSALLPPDEGALVERALSVGRQRLFADGADSSDADSSDADSSDPMTVSWADALMAVAEGSLAAEAVPRPHHDRHLVVIHVGTDHDDRANSHLHLGPALPDSLRRYLSCDGRGRVQFDSNTTPLSVGRSARIVPSRTSAPSGCTSTTSPTGRTAGQRTLPTSSPCAPGITAFITGGSWASPATPTIPTAWCSPMLRAGR